VPFWNDTICKLILEGRKVLVVAHGNSIRAIIKYIDGISDEEISELDIPTAIPLVYEFD
jgi:2,3-bisphosphoglycerate-dependent phosphoglycerate mutase